jgi:tRNA A37 threonylcarbamoyladenosine biosynthesis protein TsaE
VRHGPLGPLGAGKTVLEQASTPSLRRGLRVCRLVTTPAEA